MTNVPLEERIRTHLEERRALMLEAVEAARWPNAEDFLRKGPAQSLNFMSEIIPIIHRLYDHLPERIGKTVLDIGPQNFFGTDLLARIHEPGSHTRLKLAVTAIDITDRWELLGKLVAPTVEFLHSDIFGVADRVWDFSIASHVIEHVDDPVAFVRRMQQISRDFAIIETPWMESPIVTSGHVSTITKEMVREMGARDLNIYTNYSWGKTREVCTFWVPGLADG